ncbi:MAG: leucyl aminopeptidase [Nitrospirota bacterium]|nr:MAG: leucyl aminopeptidase [Nitrospirota bacterium]
MKTEIANIKKTRTGADALVLPVINGGKGDRLNSIDRALKGMIKKVIKDRPSISDAGNTEILHIKEKGLPGIILLVGVGDVKKTGLDELRAAGGSAFSALARYEPQVVALAADDLLQKKVDHIPFVEGFMLRNYSYDRYRSVNNKKAVRTFRIDGKHNKKVESRIKELSEITEAVHFARDLVNTPSNDLIPSDLAREARRMEGGKMKVKVMGKKDIIRAGMNAFYSVAKGSKEAPRFITLEYKGKKGPGIALVGKAITFDSGGISLKPSEGMEKMKYDMAGGAVVLGVMRAVSRLKLPVNLIGVIPSCENLPGGAASKPGDVVKTAGGKTIEIVNTDAEGRLILADAIEYTKKLSPEVIIDIATLTGACAVALGNEAIAAMGNDQKYIEKLMKSSAATGEKVWQMPLYKEYRDYIKSEVADIKNSGGRSGSLVTAGYFLKEFAGDTPWIHLDIASTAWTDKDRPYMPKGATGIGVRLLVDLVAEVSK